MNLSTTSPALNSQEEEEEGMIHLCFCGCLCGRDIRIPDLIKGRSLACHNAYVRR